MFWGIIRNILFRFGMLFLISVLNIPSIYSQGNGYKWGNLQIGGGGYVTGIAIHPLNKDIMYIRTDVGGAFRWDAGKQEWQQMLNWVGPGNANLIGVDGIALDPRHPDRIYLWICLGPEGLWKTTDGGKSYARVKGFSTASLLSWGADAPGNSNSTIYCYGKGDSNWGLYRSLDKGLTWMRINDDQHAFPAGVKCIAADRKIFGRVYAGSGGCGVYYGEPVGDNFIHRE
jgi:photosystem II stability/assembly factor-like uncharacterized protein